MNAGRIYSVVLRQYYLVRGNYQRVIPLFVWVAIDIVIWGFMTRFLNGVAASGVNFVPAILGAVLLWDLLVRVMQGTTMAFMDDSWSRNLVNIFASPLSVGEYLTGLVLCGILTSFIGLAVMLVLASAVFGLSLFAYGVMLLPFLVILFLSGIALGIVGTGIMLRYGPARNG